MTVNGWALPQCFSPSNPWFFRHGSPQFKIAPPEHRRLVYWQSLPCGRFFVFPPPIFQPAPSRNVQPSMPFSCDHAEKNATSCGREVGQYHGFLRQCLERQVTGALSFAHIASWRLLGVVVCFQVVIEPLAARTKSPPDFSEPPPC